MDYPGELFRSWTGGVIPLRISKDEIMSGRNLCFMLHDKQVQPLCGAIKVDKVKYFLVFPPQYYYLI